MNTNRNDVYINGEWVVVDHTIAVENPATAEPLGTCAAADATHLDAAVSAARAALPAWSATAPALRADQIEVLVVALEARREELVELVVAEVGAPRSIAEPWHIDASFDILRSAATHARTFAFEEDQGNLRLLRRAAGVAGFITPWNYPVYQLAAKVGSALAAGCTVVHKPSEVTPLSAYLFAEVCGEAGLPAGVFNLVPGDGPQVGAPMAAHPGVDVISFTGSTPVGRAVAASAVGRIARVSLELGGKSASIVCDDADFDNAVRWTVDSCMLNTGQTCSAWTRLLVPQHRLAEAVEIAASHADAMKVGDPTDPATELGPLINARQLQRVTAMVEEAVARGARVATRTDEVVPAAGFYLRPVVLTDLSPDDPASQEEIFGPVLVVHGYEDEEHAVALANGTVYGLAGAVWSRDVERAQEIAARLEVGQVFVNEAEFSVESAFGGWKQSGIGREFGVEGLLEFTELTVIHT